MNPWVVMWERLNAAKHLKRHATEGWDVPPVNVRMAGDGDGLGGDGEIAGTGD